MEPRRDDLSGDFAYDEAHEPSAWRPAGHAVEARPVPAPAGHRPPESDGDMSYDEAHDF